MVEGRLLRIADICDKASSNIAQNKVEGLDGDYPIYGASGYLHNVDFYHQERPYIGVVKDGSGVGRVGIYPAKSSLLGTMQYILPKKGFSLGYVAYALTHLKLASFATGAAIPHIYFKDYGQCKISVPSLSEQKRIVAELDLLTDVIDKQKQQLKELDTLAQSIFYDMFGDPVANEKGWKIKRLGEVCNFISGFAFKSELFRDNGLSVLRISNIKNNAVVEDDMVFFHTSDYKEDFSKYEVDNGDIVIAMSGATTGKLGVHRGSKTYYLNQRVGKFDIKDVSVLNKSYLFFFLQRMSEQILYDAMGVAQPNISSKQIRDYYIPLADIKLQQSFAKKIEAIEKQKENINQSIAETQKLFDYTMDKYFG